LSSARSISLTFLRRNKLRNHRIRLPPIPCQNELLPGPEAACLLEKIFKVATCATESPFLE